MSVWDDIASLFRDRGKPITGEIRAMGANTRFLDLVDASDDLKAVLGRFRNLLAEVSSEAAKKELSDINRLLASDKLVERTKGMDLLYEFIERQLKSADDLAALIARAVDEIGADALRAIPQFEFSYRRYLDKFRGKKPDSDLTFEAFLRESKSRKMRMVLKGLLSADQLSTIRKTAEIYAPALSNIQIGQKVADKVIEAIASAADLLPEADRLEKVLRKMGSATAAKTADTLESLLKARRILADLADEDVLLLFKKGLRRNFQGNIGEALALPRQAKRLEALSEGGTKPVYLAMDVRVSGQRTIVDRKAPRQSGDTSAPAFDKDVDELEFSDDLIVDLGDPPNLKILEHHETKVTTQSIRDGVRQIDDNRERMEFATSLSIGQLYKYENGKLTKVDLDDLPGFKPVPGEGGAKRLVVKEADDLIEAAKQREREFEEALDKVDADPDLDIDARMAEK
ncbi:MAG: hypothetical protein AAGF59_11855 [Pseudomonadota bacterium]